MAMICEQAGGLATTGSLHFGPLKISVRHAPRPLVQWLTPSYVCCALIGRQRVLDVVPKSIHERTPIFLGCKRDVELILKLHAEEDAKAQVRVFYKWQQLPAAAPLDLNADHGISVWSLTPSAL